MATQKVSDILVPLGVLLILFLCLFATFFPGISEFLSPDPFNALVHREHAGSSQTIRIMVDTSIPALNDIGFEKDYFARNLPYIQEATRALEAAGFKSVSERTAGKDVDTLLIKVEGQALSAVYTGQNYGGTRYSGAVLSGTISLKTPGRDVIVKEFSDMHDPPDKLDVAWGNDYYKTPSQAPFNTVFGAFLRPMADLVQEVYGVTLPSGALMP